MARRENILSADNRVENTNTTSGTGFPFESRVGAYFLAQMCLNGVVPGVPNNYKIEKITLQSGTFKTDDIVVCLKGKTDEPEIKILCQLKLGKSATISSPVFKKTIADAWIDYKSKAFNYILDRFFFVTGLFNQADNHIIQILDDIASDNSGGKGFWEKYNSTTKSYSKVAKSKFEKVISYITEANLGNKPTKEEIFNFLYAFRIIRSDLHMDAISTGGLNLSLIQSQLKGTFNGYRFIKDPQDIWNGLNIYCNNHKNGIPITREDFSSGELANLLKVERVIEQPEEYKNIKIPSSVTITSYSLDIVRLNLIGSWDENYTGDKQTIANILKVTSYEEANEKIQNILRNYPNLLHFSNGRYKLKNRKQILKETSKYITDDLIRESAPLFENILFEQDPLVGLAIDKIIEAEVMGIKMKCSPSIRSGIANTLAMLSNNSSIMEHANETASNIPSMILKKLINEDTDWNFYLSIGELLPILAEINPRIYLSCIESFIDRQMINSNEEKIKVIIQSLKNNQDILENLISSLELTAWSDDTLLSSCAILVKIATIINLDFCSNKISESITQILLPWRPNTISPVQERFSVVNFLLKNNPQIGWQVLYGLLPNKTQFSIGTHEPRWLKTIPKGWRDTKITYDEFYEQSQYYLMLSISEMNKEPSRLLDIVYYLQLYREKTYVLKVLEYFSSSEVSKLSDKVKQKIRSELNKILLYNKRRNENTRFSKELISRFQKAIKNLSFNNTFDDALLLFDTDDCFFIDNFEETSMVDKEEHLQKQREDMIKKLIELPGGYENIKKLAMKIKPRHIGLIGTALSSVDNQEIIDQLFPKLLDRSNPLWGIAAGFAWKKFFTDGISWFDRFDFSYWTKEQKITLLISFPMKRQTWDYTSKILKNNADYWNNLPIGVQYQIGDEIKDYEYAIEKFTSFNRNVTAIGCIGVCLFKKLKPDIKICLKALEASKCREDFSQVSDYDITNIFAYLQGQPRVSQDILQRIEWRYLPRFKNSFKPQAIIKNIKSDPSLFIEIIRTVYKSKNPNYPKTKLTDEKSKLLYSLLHDYEIIPGLSEKGLDENLFNNWISKALTETEKSGHLQNALYVIGEILSKRPPLEEGMYIERQIAELLNVEKNKRMRDGYYIGILNSEGIRTVDPTGKSELEKSELWKRRAKEAEALGLRYLAETLYSISRDYERQAEWGKKHAELDDYLEYQQD